MLLLNVHVFNSDKMKARYSGLMSIHTQWLFMISDTNDSDNKILSELEKSVDGDNVAFIYNASQSSSSSSTCNVRFKALSYPRPL